MFINKKIILRWSSSDYWERIKYNLLCRYFFIISWVYNELKIEFEKVQLLMISSNIIELWKLLDKYFTSELNSFLLKKFFLVTLKQLKDYLKETRNFTFGENMLYMGWWYNSYSHP